MGAGLERGAGVREGGGGDVVRVDVTVREVRAAMQ